MASRPSNHVTVSRVGSLPVVDTSTVDKDVDDDQEQLSDILKKESAFFVFTPFTNDPRRQGKGTMHKVGVYSQVVDAYPQLLPFLPGLINSNENRDQFLKERGNVQRLAYRYWMIIVDEAHMDDDGVLHVNLWGKTGSERCGDFSDGAVKETWILKGSLFTLKNRSPFYPPWMTPMVGSWEGQDDYGPGDNIQ